MTEKPFSIRVARRPDHADLAWLNAGFRKELLQAHYSRPQGRHILGCAAGFLRLLGSCLQLAAAPVALPPQRTRPGTGIRFRPAKSFRARLSRIRQRPVVLEQRPPVTKTAVSP